LEFLAAGRAASKLLDLRLMLVLGEPEGQLVLAKRRGCRFDFRLRAGQFVALRLKLRLNLLGFQLLTLGLFGKRFGAAVEIVVSGPGVGRKAVVDDLRKMIELLRELDFDLFQPRALRGEQLLGTLAIAAGPAADRLALLLRAVGLKFTLFHVRPRERVRAPRHAWNTAARRRADPVAAAKKPP